MVNCFKGLGLNSSTGFTGIYLSVFGFGSIFGMIGSYLDLFKERSRAPYSALF